MVWALVDSRSPAAGVPLDARVAGLSFPARHARIAARRGLEGVLFQVEAAADQAIIEEALAAQPPPDELLVRFAYGDEVPDPPRDYLPLMLHAVYRPADLERAAAEGSAPEPAVRVTTPAGLHAARRELERQIRKSIDQDGLIAYYTQRPIARLFTRLLIDTPVTPNQVTLAAMACGLGAAVLAGIGEHAAVAVAGFLYWFGAVVDCVDGDLARLRVKGSKMGEWLDTLADDVSTFALVAGIGIGLARTGHADAWAHAGIAAAVIGTLGNGRIYWELHRAGKTIDSAYYPWFFGTAAEKAPPAHPPGLIGRLFGGLAYLFRRDAYVTIVGLLLIFGQRRPALIVLAAGIAIIAVLLVVHLIITARRTPD